MYYKKLEKEIVEKKILRIVIIKLLLRNIFKIVNDVKIQFKRKIRKMIFSSSNPLI